MSFARMSSSSMLEAGIGKMLRLIEISDDENERTKVLQRTLPVITCLVLNLF